MNFLGSLASFWSLHLESSYIYYENQHLIRRMNNLRCCKNIEAYNHFHNISRLCVMCYHIFFSTLVKQCVIITSKHGIHKLPHELPNDLR